MWCCPKRVERRLSRQSLYFNQKMRCRILENEQRVSDSIDNGIDLVVYCKSVGLAPGFACDAHEDPKGWLLGLGLGDMECVLAWHPCYEAEKPPTKLWLVADEILKDPAQGLEVESIAPSDGKHMIEIRGFRSDRYNGIFELREMPDGWGRNSSNLHETHGYVRIAGLT